MELLKGLSWVKPLGSNEWVAYLGAFKITVLGFTWRLTAGGSWISSGASALNQEDAMTRAGEYLDGYLKRLQAELNGANNLS
jgi:hypothetical protein